MNISIANKVLPEEFYYRQSLLKSWNLYSQFSRFSVFIKRFYYQESLRKNKEFYISSYLKYIPGRKNSSILHSIRRQSHRSFID